MKKKKVFCITYGGGHVNIVKVLYPEIIKEESLELSVLGLTLADGILTDASIPHKTISDYLDILNNKEEIVTYGKILNTEVENNDDRIKPIDTIAYFGIGYRDLVKEYGELTAKKMYKKNGRKAFCPVKSMIEILKHENPDIVMLTTGVRFSLALGKAANSLNIPVISISDYPTTELIDCDSTRCVMNEWVKDTIETNRINTKTKSEIVVTGQPVFEKNLVIDKEIKEKYSKETKRDFENLIIYLGQGETNYISTAVNTVATLKKMSIKNPKIKVIIRPHPNAKSSYGFTNTESYIETKEGELKYLLSLCDLVITHTSTAGIEAALLDKPVMAVHFDGIEDKLTEFGIAEPVYEICRLEKIANELIDISSSRYKKLSESRKKFLNKQNATENIIELIKRVNRQNN